MHSRVTGKGLIAGAAILMVSLVIAGMFALNATLESALAPPPVSSTFVGQPGGPRLQVIAQPSYAPTRPRRSTPAPVAAPSPAPNPAPSPVPAPAAQPVVAPAAPEARPVRPGTVAPVVTPVTVTAAAPLVSAAAPSPAPSPVPTPAHPGAHPAAHASPESQAAVQTQKVHPSQNSQRHGPAAG